jgi:hypothetical protein
MYIPKKLKINMSLIFAHEIKLLHKFYYISAISKY